MVSRHKYSTAAGLLAVALALAGVDDALAQDKWAGGTSLETNYAWKLPRSWRVSVGPAAELRPFFGSEDREEDAPPTVRNLDLNVGVARRWLERWRFGTAVRARARYPSSEEAAREFRSWWYAERFTDAGYVRWGHRFRTEQRFRGDVGEPLALTYRHRYRVGIERPLAGRSLDFGEWYFTASVELLLSAERFAARPTAVDVRPFVSLGRNDVELGLEYRNERDLDAPANRTERTLLLAVIYSL